MISKSDFQLWKAHPATMTLLETLKGNVELAKLSWLNGSFTADSVEGTALLNANKLGYAQATLDIFEIISEGEFINVEE